MKNYAVNLLTKLLEIYSPSGKEEEISTFLVNEMKNLGFSSWRDEVGNAFGTAGTSRSIILLCGHIDTVPGYIPVRLEKGEIYGRGAVDAKASLAAMLVASSLLVKEGFPGEIIIAGLIDEEGKGKGVKHLISQGITADYAIFGEPSGLDNITIAYKGSLQLKTTCKTKTGHSSAPWLFDNAIEKAYEVWNLIHNIHFTEEQPESKFYSLTSCITGIRSRSNSSIVPSNCEFNSNFRIPPQLSPQKVVEAIKKVIEEYHTHNEGVNIDLLVEDVCPPYEADKNSLLVKAMRFAIRKNRKKPVVLYKKTGTGDMNLFGSEIKIPVITYGPGDSHLDHTPHERIGIKEFLNSIQIIYEGIKRLYYLDSHRR
ncbi:MAG: M20/M25/M40 family metallo-hydrolase [Candidatus Bathyarchaeota archaeon]|nr:MAG: M20/M25/M40 family metallo-hydrolase [Candidatus Bathyarchaeota archaeon]